MFYVVLQLKLHVMKKEYKSSEKRLADFFEASRDKWKERSLSIQKEKRKLLTEVRDLRASKEKWKQECIQARAELSELKAVEKKRLGLLKEITSL